MQITDDMVQLIYEGRSLSVPKPLREKLDLPAITITIDGHEVEVPQASLKRDEAGRFVYDADGNPVLRETTIFDAAVKLSAEAKERGEDIPISIPLLCHREHLTPVAVCRICVVDTDPNGRAKLVPACRQPVDKGMQVKTMATSQRVRDSVGLLTELLMADHPSPCAKHEASKDCELEVIAEQVGRINSRFPKRPKGDDRPRDDSSVVIAVDHAACIMCDRCVRGCNEIRNNQVIGRMNKGYLARIAFDLNAPMGKSSCVSCGECMVSCPTGALTNRAVVDIKPPSKRDPGQPQVVHADELVTMPLFEGVSHPFLKFNDGAVVRKHYKDKEIICKEGDFGSTAYFIEQGKVSVYLSASFKHVKTRKGKGNHGLFGGFIKKFRSELVSRKTDRREGEGTQRFIHIGDSISLDLENPIAEIEAGDLFGEMTCMNNYPRSATVRAKGPVTVLELQRNVLYILQRSKKSKAMLDGLYKRRAIESHLRSVPLFARIAESDSEFKRLVDRVRPQVDLLRINNGETIFNQGDLADAFYLIRSGFVKVSQRHLGGDHVLNYLGPGGYFGEIGLLTDLPEIRQLGLPAGRRTASCIALDHVDLVRISGDAFLGLLDEFPEFRSQVVQMAIDRVQENERTIRDVESSSLASFLDQGLANAQSLLVLDLEKCTRCDECTKACADAHDGVTRLIRDGLRFDKYLVASSCRSCLDPYCMVGCPVGSIHRLNDREILIEDWCIGCGKCAENCPYGNINMHSLPAEWMADPSNPKEKIAVVQQKATSCDLCHGLSSPSCVYACPHDAAHRMDGQELLDLVKAARV
jgi:CRP-like cAMP-binding protein/Fe-S-cluster-containing hydrogenase component 2